MNTSITTSRITGSRITGSRIRRCAIAVAAVITLAACGGSDDASDTPAATEAPADAAPDAAAIVATATTEAGEILTTANGLSLYGFTPDAGANPTCNDGCAAAWPPLLVDGAELPAGLDASVFSVAERDDGTFQLVAGEWPLYRFASDITAGDITGQGSGGNWFLAAPDGSLIES
ncbi:MAG: hypothetical protein AB8G26_01750 [Ilumatobacter sp.]